jgi:opacity protein-like surface antigen
VQTRESTSYGLKYGVRGGFTISHLDFERQPPMDNKHRNSMYVGFFANIGLSRTLSLAPELQFSAEGANDETLHLDYIQMPVMLRLRINEKFHIGLGPQMGVKVHKADDGFKNLAYSAVAGIDYKINYALFADFRYNYGIRNVFDEATGIVAKNRNIQLGVGYKF